MMKKEIKLLETTLAECLKKIAETPEFNELYSIEAQLRYLLGLLKGTDHDRSRLDKIILGIYAVREFDMRDAGFAEKLYNIESIVDLMKDRKL